MDLKPGRAESEQNQQQRNEKRAATADLLLLLKRRPEVIALRKSQTDRAPAPRITFSVKTTLVEHPFYSSFRNRHVAN